MATKGALIPRSIDTVAESELRGEPELIADSGIAG